MSLRLSVIVVSLMFFSACVASDEERAAAAARYTTGGTDRPTSPPINTGGTEGQSEAGWAPPVPVPGSSSGFGQPGELNWVPPSPAPVSLQAALDRAMYVVSGKLGTVGEPKEVLAGPIGTALDALYARYQLTATTLEADGVVDMALTALLASSGELQVASTAGDIDEFATVYGPYATATASGGEHEYKLSDAFVDALPVQPAAFETGARVVLFVQVRMVTGLGMVYEVIQAVPLVNDQLDARELQDGKFVPLDEFMDDLNATFTAREAALAQ